MAYFMQPIIVTAALTLNQDSHAGNVLVMNSATGRIMTLPASTGKGDVYTVFIRTAVSSGNHVIAVANATDVMNGGVSVSTDAGGVAILAAATDDTITMNGTTTGGLAGSWVRLTDAVSGFWMVEGFLVSSGAEATPFSAAVS